MNLRQTRLAASQPTREPRRDPADHEQRDPRDDEQRAEGGIEPGRFRVATGGPRQVQAPSRNSASAPSIASAAPMPTA
jgi:hypothetical protein